MGDDGAWLESQEFEMQPVIREVHPAVLAALKGESMSQISDTITKLCVSAKELNTASDDFTAAIERIDAALKGLCFGLVVWVDVVPTLKLRLSYSRVGGLWGLTISRGPEAWLFNSAPRSLRTRCVDDIPALLTTMASSASEFAAEIRIAVTKLNAMFKQEIA